jgi:hypothetical protein
MADRSVVLAVGVVMIEFFITTLRLARSVASAWRRDPQFRSLVLLVLITLLGGTIFYSSVEGWSIVDAFYFSVTTLRRFLLQRHHAYYCGPRRPRTNHDDRQALHGDLHLRGSQHHLGVHRHRGEGDLEGPDWEER